MKKATLLFLIKKTGNEITEICLAMKKRGFGMGRWNGVGGKVTEGETVEGAVIRETKEEIDVTAKDIRQVAELSFSFAMKPEWNQKVYVYFTEKWNGVPRESEEMNPKWYPVADIPFAQMWPDDIFWLPRAIEGQLLKGAFVFGESDVILSQNVEVVEGFGNEIIG